MHAPETMTLLDLRSEADRCRSAIGECETILAGLRRRLSECDAEVERRTRPAPVPQVSVHALLRYLERVQGVDVDAARRAILSPQVTNAMMLGASAVTVDGLRFVLEGNTVKTVIGKG